MNLTYIWVIIGVLVPVFMLCGPLSRRLSRTTIVTLSLVVFAFTLVFDNLIVGLNIVAYNTEKTLGLTVPIAPIEDFGYLIVGVITVPVLWLFFGRKKPTDD